jgi:hypothetical protein
MAKTYLGLYQYQNYSDMAVLNILPSCHDHAIHADDPKIIADSCWALLWFSEDQSESIYLFFILLYLYYCICWY